MSRVQVAKSLSLLADTALGHLAEDPLLLAVQSARRLPAGVRERVGALIGWRGDAHPLRQALASFLTDHQDASRQALEAAAPSRAWTRSLAAELAVQLGQTRLTADWGLPPRTRARDLWSRGLLSEAVSVLDHAPSSRAQHARLRSEMATMSPGFTLPLLDPSPAWRQPGRGAPSRVLHVLTNSYPHTRSGYAVRSHAVLRSQREAGLTVSAVTRIGYPVTVGRMATSGCDVVDGIEYHRLLPVRLAPTPAARLVQMCHLLSRQVERCLPHVLHTTTSFHNALVTQAVARSYGLPWVYEMRGVLELTWVASRPPEQQAQALGSERFRLLRDKETEMARAADAVVVLSELQKADLVARGVPGQRVTVVPNAVDDDVLAAPPVSPASARGALGLPPEGTWVGSVSSMVDYEGLDVLLRAVARARAAGQDLRCLLVGDGVSRAWLVRLAGDLGLDETVCVMPGRVPPSQALAWYQALDVFCVPRRDTPVCHVVTPIKPLTALALGRPVVVSDLPALTETWQGGCCYSFPAGDDRALAELLHRRLLSPVAPAPPHNLPRWSHNGRTYATMYEELG